MREILNKMTIYSHLSEDQKQKSKERLKRWRILYPDKVRLQNDRANNRIHENIDIYREKWKVGNKKRREVNPQKVKNDKKKSYMKCFYENPEKYRNKIREKRMVWAESRWASKLLIGAKHRSTVKNHDIDINENDIKELWDKQDGRCFWTNVPLTNKLKDTWTVSLDRVDSKLGYTKGNVVLCGWRINHAKSNMSPEDFKKMLLDIITHRQFNQQS